MKKLTLLTVLSFLFCNLSAQNVNDDVLLLQKSNASLKNRLNQQNQALLKQIQTTDSIIALLQSTTAEIKKTGDNQNSITQSVASLQQQDANTNQALINVSDAFSERKQYAIYAVIGSVLVLLLCFFYLRRKLSAINNSMKQNEENINKRISQMGEHLDKEIGEVKDVLEKQNGDHKEKLTKLVANTNESIHKMNNEVNKAMESQLLSFKEIFNAQLSQSVNEFGEKITELNKTTEKKISAIKNELSTNISEISKGIRNTN